SRPAWRRQPPTTGQRSSGRGIRGWWRCDSPPRRGGTEQRAKSPWDLFQCLNDVTSSLIRRPGRSQSVWQSSVSRCSSASPCLRGDSNTKASNLLMSRILVTGAAGFIGFHLAQRLLERGDEVVGLDSVNDYYDVKLKEDRLSLLEGQSGFTFVHESLENTSAMQ